MQGSSTEHVGDLHLAQRRAQGFESLHGLHHEVGKAVDGGGQLHESIRSLFVETSRPRGDRGCGEQEGSGGLRRGPGASGLQLEDRKPFVRRVVRPRARRNALHACVLDANLLTQQGGFGAQDVALSHEAYSGDAAVHAPTSDVHEGEVGERDDADHRGVGLIGQGLVLTQWNGETLEYDDFGSLERRTSLEAETTFTYDVWGNLHEVQTTDSDTGSQTTITYGTDGHNRRISKSVDGALRWKALYRSSLQPAAWIKTNDDGTQEVTHFVYATGRNSPDLMIRDSRVYWLIVDHVGSVRRVVDVSTGAELQQIDYDAWGQITSEVGAGFQPFAFGGGILDRDTGLVRFGARDYDPRLGRWTTKDPLRFDGGSTNLYQYANGDPVNFVDPGGRIAWAAWFMFGMVAASPFVENCDDFRGYVDMVDAGLWASALGPLAGRAAQGAVARFAVRGTRAFSPSEGLANIADRGISLNPMEWIAASRIVARSRSRGFAVIRTLLRNNAYPVGKTPTLEVSIFSSRTAAIEEHMHGVFMERALRRGLASKAIAQPGFFLPEEIAIKKLMLRGIVKGLHRASLERTLADYELKLFLHNRRLWR